MGELDRTLGDVRQRIAKYQKSRRLNEQNTKATLIEPVLRALGWNVEDLDEVQREYKVKRRDRPVDYALLELRNPRLFIEAKALGEDLSDRRWVSQIMGYATVAGVEWIALTNGDEYRIYNAHAAVHVDEKLFRTVRVSDPSSWTSDTLALLSKQRLAENRIEVLWRAHFVDRQVRAAIEELLSAEGNGPLVRLLGKHTKNLSPKEIRESLGRCRIEIDFPVDVADEAPPPTSGEGSKRKRRTTPAKTKARRTTTVADLVRAGLLSAGSRLVRSYKGSDLFATVTADGAILMDGERFESPSTAGSAARATVIGKKGGKLPSTNGWTFWSVELPTGAVVLDVLRQQYKGGDGGGQLRLVAEA